LFGYQHTYDVIAAGVLGDVVPAVCTRISLRHGRHSCFAGSFLFLNEGVLDALVILLACLISMKRNVVYGADTHWI
jgi:hypothetical protein